MKLKLKLIAAALALATGSAHAALDNSGTGNGSLILGVVNYAAGVSATFDLGINMDSFLPGSTTYQQWTLGAGDYAAAWSSFVAGVGANMSSSKYVVFAADSVGTAAGDVRYMSTSVADMTVATNKPTNSQLINFNQIDGHINPQNTDVASLGNHDTVANGALFATTNDTTNYVGSNQAFGTTGKWQGTNSPFIAIQTVNSAVEFYLLSTSSLSGLNRANVVAYNDFTQDFFLNSSTGTLTYGVAPVPEPETYALMLAGLGLVGFWARRRKAV